MPAPSVLLPEGASGLRPAAMFVAVAVVLIVVVGRAAWIHGIASGAQPDAELVSEAPLARFLLNDRDGRPLAVSVESFDVTASPRSLWRSHTPRRLADRFAALLGGATTSREDVAQLADPREILRRTMPRELQGSRLSGRLVPAAPRLLDFDAEAAERVRAWLDTGALDADEQAGDAPGPIRGLELVAVPTPAASISGAGAPADQGPRYTLAIDPVDCLSREARVDRFGEWDGRDGSPATASPERWTRALLADLVALIGRDAAIARLDDEARRAVRALPRADADARLRDEVWAELMPSRFRVVARAIDPVTAHALTELLAAEAVSPYQIQLVPRVERRHPTRPDGLPVPPTVQDSMGGGSEDAFTLLGHWGHLDEDRADARARRDLDTRPHVVPWESAEDPFVAYRRSLVVDRRPWSGLELLCQTELENGEWAPLVDGLKGRTYERRTRHVARDRRKEFDGKVPNYFGGTAPASEVPTIESTLDAALQEVLHTELALLVEEHAPALAMGIVVDVETGDVLALDARSLYGYSGFAPVLHEFTPGSTFKPVIMVQALDAGLVRPETTFATHAPAGILLRHGRASRRISEAEGAPTEGRITAAHGIAESCNAVLVQVAHLFEPSVLRERLLDLGYSQAPHAGLGPERSGRIPPLKKGTWSRIYTHASVGFGHELTVTLWQHAGALATILRGGERRPLRLVRAVERGGERYVRPLEDGARVLSERACDEVRDMLALGAEIGTGRHVAMREQNPEFSWIGTKTGTTEKVASELCVHLELEALAEAALDERPLTRAERDALFRMGKPHRRSSCYTSSMLASARMVVDGEEREIMVLVVADDPAGPERFGSRVTGPTTIAILRQAFGLRRERADEVQGSRAAEAERPRATASAPTGPVLFDPGTAPRRGAAAASGLYDASWLDSERPWRATGPTPVSTSGGAAPDASRPIEAAARGEEPR